MKDMKEYPFDLSWMEGMIGGSLLDDLRHISKSDSINDGDFFFKMVNEPDIDLEIDGINPNHTFIAYSVKEDYEYILLPDVDDGFAWIPIWN